MPRAVFNEVVNDGAGQPGSAELARAAWTEIADHDERDPLFAGFLQILQIGESAAISIAHQRSAGLFLCDDNHARMTAKSSGLSVKGTLGLLVLAKQRGHIDAVAPKIRSLRSQSVWMSSEIIRRTLHEAGEKDADIDG